MQTKVKAHNVRVVYEMSSKFKEKFEEVNYRIFNRMMKEDEELRRQHQDQPYESTTGTLFNQFGFNFKNIKDTTSRSDQIVTSTISISLGSKDLPLRYFELNKKLSNQPLSERVPEEKKREVESLLISDEEDDEAE